MPVLLVVLEPFPEVTPTGGHRAHTTLDAIYMSGIGALGGQAPLHVGV